LAKDLISGAEVAARRQDLAGGERRFGGIRRRPEHRQMSRAIEDGLVAVVTFPLVDSARERAAVQLLPRA
jgi:hypothetical protein